MKAKYWIKPSSKNVQTELSSVMLQLNLGIDTEWHAQAEKIVKEVIIIFIAVTWKLGNGLSS